MPGEEAQQGQEAAQAIRVVTEPRNLRTQPFIVPDETNLVGKAWEEWLGFVFPVTLGRAKNVARKRGT